jgi:hypothetical protein
MLECWEGLVLRELPIVPSSNMDFPKGKWYSQFVSHQCWVIFFWLTVERRLATEHASKKQRGQAVLSCAGGGAPSNICFNLCRPWRAVVCQTHHQKPQPWPGWSWQQHHEHKSLPRPGCWAESLGSWAQGFWLIPHRREVSSK